MEQRDVTISTADDVDDEEEIPLDPDEEIVIDFILQDHSQAAG